MGFAVVGPATIGALVAITPTDLDTATSVAGSPGLVVTPDFAVLSTSPLVCPAVSFCARKCGSSAVKRERKQLRSAMQADEAHPLH